ncbi:hypothetical protein BGX38DRAFT_1272322 [Terfezia claveryi]|nr:hypothetical protein BGX38DRAFT_1272322 [Terfezia claveryi]
MLMLQSSKWQLVESKAVVGSKCNWDKQGQRQQLARRDTSNTVCFEVSEDLAKRLKVQRAHFICNRYESTITGHSAPGSSGKRATFADGYPGAEAEEGPAPPNTPSKEAPPPPPKYHPRPPAKAKTHPAPPERTYPTRARAVILHAATTKYKPGLMRRWIEEDNKGAQILGIRWLTQEERRIGKLASSP